MPAGSTHGRTESQEGSKRQLQVVSRVWEGGKLPSPAEAEDGAITGLGRSGQGEAVTCSAHPSTHMEPCPLRRRNPAMAHHRAIGEQHPARTCCGRGGTHHTPPWDHEKGVCDPTQERGDLSQSTTGPWERRIPAASHGRAMAEVGHGHSPALVRGPGAALRCGGCCSRSAATPAP